jgi:ketosteroid isomerase-like protein
MKHLISIFMMTVVSSGAVSAADFSMKCAKAGEERFVQVISPGMVGQNCDVRYTRDQGRNVSIPYHADNSPVFCNEKAAALVQTLNDAGYSCAPVMVVANALPEPALKEAPAADSSAVTPPPQRVVVQAPEAIAPTPEVVTPAPAPESLALDMAAPALAQQTAPELPIIAEAPEDETVLADKMSVILSETPPALEGEPEEMAVHGPAQLTSETTELTAAVRPSSVVGRIVGAEPEEPKPVIPTPVTVANTQEPLSAATPVTQAAFQEAPKPAKKVETDDVKKTTRTPEEIILATLNAQVAAWNEGNLQAFMDIYWKSDDLKFVSGTTITKGWSSTLKQYRERYSNGAGLGRLTLGKPDVQMVTDDVAVITGRFHHSADEASTSGAFSLVMRRFDGLWRIVHDHSVDDPIRDTRP